MTNKIDKQLIEAKNQFGDQKDVIFNRFNTFNKKLEF